MISNALEARKITIGYPGKKVLAGIDVEIPKGRCVAMLGRNGAGKSTLLRTLAGIHKPLSGSVVVGGREISTLGPTARGRRIAYLPQQVSPEIPFTVFEIVLMGRYPHRGLAMFASANDRKVVRSVIERTKLGDLADKKCTQLSGGEFQRVLVASILAQEAPVMLLDEPTASLDLEHRNSIMKMVGEDSTSDRTVVVATHDLNLAAAHCSWVVALDCDGRVDAGPAEQILTEQFIERIFGVQVRTVEVDLPSGGTRRQFVVVS
jgi:iron complex transport system ATP-binding protein